MKRQDEKKAAMRVLLLGATYSQDRRSEAVDRDSVRVDEMVVAGHEVRCVSLVQDAADHPWWARLDMTRPDFDAALARAFPDVEAFDVAIVDYVWMPVSVTWLQSSYFRGDAEVVRTMRRMGVPLWVPANAATRWLLQCRHLLKASTVSWDRAAERLPLVEAENRLGGLVGKDMDANRRAHAGWLRIHS